MSDDGGGAGEEALEEGFFGGVDGFYHCSIAGVVEDGFGN